MYTVSQLLLVVLLSLYGWLLVDAQPTPCPVSHPSRSNPIGCVLRVVNISSTLPSPNAVAFDHVGRNLIITDTVDELVAVYTRHGRFIKYLNTTATGAVTVTTAGVDVHGYVYLLNMQGDNQNLLVYSPAPAYTFLNLIPLDATEYSIYYGPAAGSIRVHSSEPYLFMSSSYLFRLAALKLSYHPSPEHATSITATPAGRTSEAYETFNLYDGVAIDPSTGHVAIIGMVDFGDLGSSQYIQYYEVDYSQPDALTFTLGRHLSANNSALSQAYDYGIENSLSASLNIDQHGRIVVTSTTRPYGASFFTGNLIFMDAHGKSLAGAEPIDSGSASERELVQSAIFHTGNIVWVPSESGQLIIMQGPHKIRQ